MSLNGTGNFARSFGIVIGMEGGYTALASDPGNWTGGRVGVGALKGTKYGISAAAYPHLDIASLTLDDAQGIYRRDYWDAIEADTLPAKIALIVFDAAVNCGPARAAKWLQHAVGASMDGIIGPATLRAIGGATANPDETVSICTEIQASRLVYLTNLPTWKTFGLGWARRVCHLCSIVQSVSESVVSPRVV